MKIRFTENFNDRLHRQLQYIKRDNPTAARNFKKNLISEIKSIPERPLSFRKSKYADDINTRDLIFKGYTIVLKISEDTIDVFGFIKHQESPTDK